MTSRRRAPGNPNLLTSVVLVTPLLLLYEIGVLFTDVMNGADFLTGSLLRLLDLRGFVILQLGLLGLFALLIIYLRHRQRFELRRFAWTLVESTVYALTMGTLIVFLMEDVLGVDPRLAAGATPQAPGLLTGLVMSIGAGVHEELVFRLGLVGGLFALLNGPFGFRRWSALLVAIVVSSLLFSAAHHIGPLGEPLRFAVFIYRALAGVLFALIYQFRSFATAVYTHALYDIYVLLLA
jgi:membrane protease YdiL (CAAX protease family)